MLSPASLGDDHFRFEVVELFPEVLGFEDALHVAEVVAIALRPHPHLVLLRQLRLLRLDALDVHVDVEVSVVVHVGVFFVDGGASVLRIPA